jgi:serine/threonine protein kinase
VQALKAEISTLSELSHIGIMKFYDAIDEGGTKVSIIMEYINGNNLY